MEEYLTATTPVIKLIKRYQKEIKALNNSKKTFKEQIHVLKS